MIKLYPVNSILQILLAFYKNLVLALPPKILQFTGYSLA